MKTGRRNLLKALVLGGGALTVSSLPKKWAKPVIDFAVVPAHAQATGLVYASNVELNWGWCVVISGAIADVTGVDGGYEVSPGGTPKFRFAGQIPSNGDVGSNAIQLVAQGSNCPTPALLSRDAYLANVTATTATLYVEQGEGGYFDVALTLVATCPSWTNSDCTPR